MAKGRVLGAPKRTTRIPARGRTLDAAETFLSASLVAEEEAERLAELIARVPTWRFRRRARLHRERYRALEHYWQTVRAARDLANGRRRELAEPDL